MLTMEEPTVPTTQKIDFPSRTENLTLIEKMVDEVCEEHKINEDYYGNILIALTEAVNNAIQHGNKKDSNKMISVAYQSNAKKLVFTVKDEGEGFDYDNLPDPTEPANLEKTNGRGVFLMRNLADEVSFYDEGSKVELNFNISAN